MTALSWETLEERRKDVLDHAARVHMGTDPKSLRFVFGASSGWYLELDAAYRALSEAAGAVVEVCDNEVVPPSQLFVDAVSALEALLPPGKP